MGGRGGREGGCGMRWRRRPEGGCELEGGTGLRKRGREEACAWEKGNTEVEGKDVGKEGRVRGGRVWGEWLGRGLSEYVCVYVCK